MALPETVDLAIIGGGPAGLFSALRIRELRPDWRILILEASDAPGGKARTIREGGYACEVGPECAHIPLGDPALRWLTAALPEVSPVLANPAGSRRFILKNGEVFPLGLRALLGGRLLPRRALFGLLAEPFAPGPEGEVSLAEFGRRRLGAAFVENLLTPMCRGIFAGDPELLSLEHAFPRFHELDVSGGLLRGMLRRKPADHPGPRRMWSAAGGLSEVFEAAAAKLGDDLRLEHKVEALQRAEAGGFELRARVGGEGGPMRATRAARVLETSPAFRAAELARGLDEELARILGELEFIPIAVVALGYPDAQVRRPLNGFGILVGVDERPEAEQSKALGILCSSAVFPGRAPEGHSLFRVMMGGAPRPELPGRPAQELEALARAELGAVVGAEGPPAFARVVSWRRGIPQYRLGHGAWLARLEAALARAPGYTVTGSSYRGPGLSDVLRRALEAAERVCAGDE